MLRTHRPPPEKLPWGYNETDLRCTALKSALAAQIAKLAAAGYTGFLSGMAEGTDTWAALAVLTLKQQLPALELHCVLPGGPRPRGRFIFPFWNRRIPSYM